MPTRSELTKKYSNLTEAIASLNETIIDSIERNDEGVSVFTQSLIEARDKLSSDLDELEDELRSQKQ